MTKKQKKPLQSYHFNCGNSTCGPIGFCARIVATSLKKAVKRLQALLPEDVELIDPSVDEYVTVYFGIDNITVNDIDAVEEIAAEDQKAIRKEGKRVA